MILNKSKSLLVLSGILFGLLIFIISPVSTVFSDQDTILEPEISDISGKIVIDGNWTDAQSAGICTGEGSASDPYLIKDKEVNAGGVGNCITINNAYEYFMIQNCTIRNSGTMVDDTGIYIENASNGRIFQNGITNNTYGIFMKNSHNINITYNSIGNDKGIKYSDNCTDMWFYLNSFIGSITYDIYFGNLSSTTYHTPTQFLYTYENENFTNYLGNYWSTHDGGDNNNDGVAENAVVFTGGTIDPIIYYVDRYPLMQTHSNYTLIEPYFPPDPEPDPDPEPKIPGYNMLLLGGVLSISLVIIILKTKQESRF